ncbi:hypothetical protein RHMOL_Rhmol12G0124300 [Rhododendron molle]|uniref:Uncharacterized protein n=1 Tax=Rhododendron molle TaxID=49168 RepID=A0ACC0LHK6_RHOML|nr:hypothetical protein RHMOL_Rhmol12G0124300 [Rhododendron molle]
MVSATEWIELYNFYYNWRIDQYPYLIAFCPLNPSIDIYSSTTLYFPTQLPRPYLKGLDCEVTVDECFVTSVFKARDLAVPEAPSQEVEVSEPNTSRRVETAHMRVQSSHRSFPRDLQKMNIKEVITNRKMKIKEVMIEATADQRIRV